MVVDKYSRRNLYNLAALERHIMSYRDGDIENEIDICCGPSTVEVLKEKIEDDGEEERFENGSVKLESETPRMSRIPKALERVKQLLHHDHNFAMVPLKRLVENDLTGVVIHPVISKFIELKWKRFGFAHTLREMILYLIFLILLGMSLGEFHNDDRHTFPSDTESIRRIIVDILLVFFVFYYMGKEVNEAWIRTRHTKKYAQNRRDEIQSLLKKCPSSKQWHDTAFLHARLNEAKSCNYWLEYVKDPWNWAGLDMLWMFINCICIETRKG